MNTNRKNKALILSVIGILGLIIITVGVTYAFFNYAKEGTTENSITSGTITFLYTEVSGVGRGIRIQDAYPMSDEIGKVQVGEGKVFDFKITSNTSNSTSIPYEVTARKKSTSTLDEEAVKLYLTEVDGSLEEEVLLENYSNLVQTTKVDRNKYIEKTIYEGRVPANSVNYEKNFRLRMWIDESTDFSPIKGENGEDIYPYNGKEFTLTVNVYANGKVVTEADIIQEGNTNIKSISIDNKVLEKVEDKDYDYEALLSEKTTSAVIDVETENPYASVKIEKIDSLVYSEGNNIKRLSTKNTVELNPGNNYFKITVTSEDKKNSQEYKVCVRLAKTLTQVIFDQYTVIEKSPTLTTTSEIVESGLYSSTDTNSGKPTYYFRGNVENYVDFAGYTWKIIRINEDETVRLILWSTGINNSYSGRKFSRNNMLSSYYQNSDAKEYLEDWYKTNIIDKGYQNYVTEGSYCQQAKVVPDTSNTLGNVAMKYYNDYTANFKCETDSNGYGIVKANVGLITYDEVIFAGGFPKKGNTEYYLYRLHGDTLTMSPAGNNAGIYTVWYIYDTSPTANWSGSLRDKNVDGGAMIYPVINLKADVAATGTGIGTDPFVIQ